MTSTATETRGEAPPPLPPVTLSSLLKPLLLVLVVAASLCVVYYSPAGELLAPANVQALHDWMHRWDPFTPLAFVLAATLAMALGAPRLVLSALAGLAFGFLVGTLLAQIATLIAGMADFAYGRYFGREFVEQRLRPRSRTLDRAMVLMQKHAIGANILIRFAPIGHFFTSNLLMSVTPISAREFLIGTAIGTLPGTVIYALLGSAGEGHRLTRFLAGTAVMLAFSIGYLIYLRRRPPAAAAATARHDQPDAPPLHDRRTSPAARP